MPLKYLSPEWIDAYNATVAADDSVRAAMKGKSAVLQMLIAEAPGGEIHYWLRIGDGTVAAALGDAETPRSPSASRTTPRPRSTGASGTGRRRSPRARSRSRAR